MMSKKDTGIMTSQTLGALSSDQKIDIVFHAFGYSIPVGKDGRRMWPTKFKREMAQQMNSGKLAMRDVQRTCRVSENTAYKWKKRFGDNGTRKPPVIEPIDQAFSEIKVVDDQPENQLPPQPIILKHRGCELLIPRNYPVAQLAQLVQALGGKI